MSDDCEGETVFFLFFFPLLFSFSLFSLTFICLPLLFLSPFPTLPFATLYLHPLLDAEIVLRFPSPFPYTPSDLGPTFRFTPLLVFTLNDSTSAAARLLPYRSLLPSYRRAQLELLCEYCAGLIARLAVWAPFSAAHRRGRRDIGSTTPQLTRYLRCPASAHHCLPLFLPTIRRCLVPPQRSLRTKPTRCLSPSSTPARRRHPGDYGEHDGCADGALAQRQRQEDVAARPRL